MKITLLIPEKYAPEDKKKQKNIFFQNREKE